LATRANIDHACGAIWRTDISSDSVEIGLALRVDQGNSTARLFAALRIVTVAARPLASGTASGVTKLPGVSGASAIGCRFGASHSAIGKAGWTLLPAHGANHFVTGFASRVTQQAGGIFDSACGTVAGTGG
jgi:hypothetical protein